MTRRQVSRAMFNGAVALALACGACARSNNASEDLPGSPTDTTPPTVTSTGPTVNVPVDATITVGFSEPLDCSTVTTGTFQVAGVSGVVSCNAAIATYQPAANLAYSTTYTVTLATGPNGIKDLAGNGLAGMNSWNFTTEHPTLSFMAYGDSRAGNSGDNCIGNAIHISLVNRMLAETADFVFHLGDMITGFDSSTNWMQDGPCTGATAFGSFKNMIAPLQNKPPAAGLPTFYFPVIGNHDDNWGSGWYPDSFGDGFCDVFDPHLFVPNHTQQPYFLDPAATRYSDSDFASLACSKTMSDVYPRYLYYSFNYKNSHFAVMRISSDFYDVEECNSCGTNRSNYDDYFNIHQLDWLRADLAAADADAAIEHIFVFLHVPLFTSSYGHNANVSWQTLAKEFSAHKVKLVFSGHNHVYERSKPVFVSSMFPDGVEDIVNGTVYVVTGGGGSDLYGFNSLPWFTAARALENHYVKIDVAESTIVVRAIRADGTILDSFAR